ncbi:MAG: galactokinase [Clostridiales bacterium]|nr:galactokinase [Clostridiales bacterium]
MGIENILTAINEGKSDPVFAKLYGPEQAVLSYQKTRYIEAVEAFYSAFRIEKNSAGEFDKGSVCEPEMIPAAETAVFLFSAPGRTEIGGNHTDHQHGRVLAAAVDLDAIAVASLNNLQQIRILSKGYPLIAVDLSDLSPKAEEQGTTSALVRGVAAQFQKLGTDVLGFDAYVTSDVLTGSGLSSSAAFEVLIGTIIDHLSNEGKAGAVNIAKFGKIAENLYFGKASGLMDQMVSSVGGFVKIDFADPESPVIEKIDRSLDEAGIALIVTDTKGSHADLSGEYTAIPEEMKAVASFFGKSVLREVDEQEFYRRISELRTQAGDSDRQTGTDMTRDAGRQEDSDKTRDTGRLSDRAILRSAHFFDEDRRAAQEAEALEEKDFRRFFDLVNASGESSATLLQNLYCSDAPQTQGIPLALLLSRRVLAGEGACRVHGGGFAGTIQAFVPKEKVSEYIDALESVFGKGACHILRIRPEGGIRIL